MGRLWERTQFAILLIITPAIFGFQMIILFPKLVKIVEAGPIQQYVHIFLATLLFINVTGNMIMSSSNELNILREVFSGDRIYCDYCKKWRPTNTLHCKKCNACVLNRDHHCSYLVNCIGQHNKRYYVLLLGHVSISMIYATVYNYQLVAPKNSDDWGFLIHFARLVNPGVWYLLPAPFGKKDIYTIYMLMNGAIGVWAGHLFCVHMKNSALGVTAYEAKYKPEMKDLKKWDQNLLAVFGERWYLAAVWPFCSSPVPKPIKVE